MKFSRYGFDSASQLLPILEKGLRQDLADLIADQVSKDIIELKVSENIVMLHDPTSNSITLDFGMKLAYKDIAKISQLQEENSRLRTELETYKEELRTRLTQVLGE